MKLEAWPGGRWYRDLGNDAGHFWGNVQAIKPPILLEICGAHFMSYPAISNVQYRLTEENGITRLKFTHRAMGQISHDAQFERGWRSFRMKNLFEAAMVEEVKERMAQLRPESERLWGKMNAAQALAHCSAAMEMAMGKTCPPRILIGRLLGRLAKKSVIVNGTPMRRNAITEKSCLVTDERDFVVERQRLRESIDRFATGGPGVCTKHPHFFFGPLTPVEWAVLMYQHLDHHLRQFRV